MIELRYPQEIKIVAYRQPAWHSSKTLRTGELCLSSWTGHVCAIRAKKEKPSFDSADIEKAYFLSEFDRHWQSKEDGWIYLLALIDDKELRRCQLQIIEHDCQVDPKPLGECAFWEYAIYCRYDPDRRYEFDAFDDWVTRRDGMVKFIESTDALADQLTLYFDEDAKIPEHTFLYVGHLVFDGMWVIKGNGTKKISLTTRYYKKEGNL